MENKQLVSIAKKNKTANRVLNFVADRRRNTKYTAFSGLRADLKKKDGKPVDRVDFDQTFVDLQKIGVGKLNCSKRGVCLGFKWTVPIRKIGEMLKNGNGTDRAKATEKSVAQAKNPTMEAASTNKKVTLVIIRRNRAPETIESDEAHIAQIRPQLEASQ